MIFKYSVIFTYSDENKISQQRSTKIATWEDPESKNILNLGLQLRDSFYDAGITLPGTRMQLGETIREWIPTTGEQKIITTVFNLLNPLTYRGSLSNDSYVVPVNCDGSKSRLDSQ